MPRLFARTIVNVSRYNAAIKMMRAWKIEAATLFYTASEPRLMLPERVQFQRNLPAAIKRCCAAVFVLSLAAPVCGALIGDGPARIEVALEGKHLDDLKTRQQLLETRLAKIEENLKNQPVLELFTQIEAIKLEISRLRGQVEVVNNNVENATKRQRDMYADLDTRLRRLEQQNMAAAAQAPQRPPIPAAPVAVAPVAAAGFNPPAKTAAAQDQAVNPAPAVVSAATLSAGADSSENRVYEMAHAQRRAGNYPAAIAAFQNYLKQHPKGNLAPRAHYWIGDSYYNLRDFKRSIASQQALLKAYPESPTVPDAMLNIASSQIQMGESIAAKRTLDELIARFPLSEAAEKAKLRFATLAPAASAPSAISR